VEKKEVYQRIKIYGFLSYIPIILAAGPLSGWALGSFLERKFNLPNYISLILSGLGLIAAVIEIARAVRLVSKIDKDNF